MSSSEGKPWIMWPNHEFYESMDRLPSSSSATTRRRRRTNRHRRRPNWIRVEKKTKIWRKKRMIQGCLPCRMHPDGASSCRYTRTANNRCPFPAWARTWANCSRPLVFRRLRPGRKEGIFQIGAEFFPEGFRMCKALFFSNGKIEFKPLDLIHDPASIEGGCLYQMIKDEID